MCADETETTKSVFLEYYELPFVLFHKALKDLQYNDDFSQARRDFWAVVPPGTYGPEKGRAIVLQYLKRLDARLAAVISQHSIGYWLHIYRRLAPASIGKQKDPATVGLVRAAMEAAIQKYAQPKRCDGVAFSAEVGVEQIFDGLLLAPEFAFIKDSLSSQPSQLVLTKFGVTQLMEVYEAEKIAYEVWRSGATLRTLGKGAPLVVDPTSKELFYDNRSDELNQLIDYYDCRDMAVGVSATGTVFSEFNLDPKKGGNIFLPVYNVNQFTAADFARVFNSFGLEIAHPEAERPNFIWFPFNLAGFYRAHLPFAEAYKDQRGIDLEWIVALIGTLGYRAQYLWNEDPLNLWRFWKRAYEGPSRKQLVIQEIKTFLPPACELLGLRIDPLSVDVGKTISFLSLNSEDRAHIDLLCSGPHALSLPLDDRVFIDYAWLQRTLYNLFYEVKLSDQNFKGIALEEIARKGKSALPYGPCQSLKGDRRQIDAAFAREDKLIIAECRAFARSFGVDRGEPEAIRYRLRKLNDALRDVDGKARWLASNPKGANYDISPYRRIIPVAVTPFREYIPSLNSWYWLTSSMARALSPTELDELLDSPGSLEEASCSSNCVIPNQIA
jgi:hypothetical protein